MALNRRKTKPKPAKRRNKARAAGTATVAGTRVRRNPPPAVTDALSRESTAAGAGQALGEHITGLGKADVARFHRWWERDIKGRGPRGKGDRAYHPEELEDFWQAYRRESLIRTGSIRRNGFGAALVEGAGTGIGLGLAATAALPLVRKAFPGLVQGKVNPAAGPYVIAPDDYPAGTRSWWSVYGPEGKVNVKGGVGGWRFGTAGSAQRAADKLNKAYAKSTRQSNPGPAAESMYESFHGRPATGYEEIIEDRNVHGWLAALGTLVSLKVIPQYGSKKGRTLELDFGKAGGILLCANETGTQLYFRGGNQELDPKALGFKGNQITKDLMTLGVLWEITYRTKKGFDGFKTIDYYHQVSEVSKDTHPVLLYDTMNHELQIAGGSYECLPGGITD